MHKKRTVIWISVVLVVVLIGILIAFLTRIPSTSAQLPPNTAPISALISQPSDGSTWPSDTPIPVLSMVTAGTTLKSVELWADGNLVDTKTPPAGKNSAFDVWSWIPLTEGTHALFVRATDENGRTAESNAVHITASAEAGLIGGTTAKAGDTLQSLAEQNGVPLEQAEAINPGLDPAAALDPGTEVLLPLQPFSMTDIGEPPSSPPPADPVTPAVEGVKPGAAFYLEGALNLTKNTPAAPALQAAVDGCSVTLSFEDAADTEDGFFVYALPETTAGFQRIANLQAHPGPGSIQYTLPDQYGHAEFYVSAYNSAGESPSAPVAVNISSVQCAPAQAVPGGLDFNDGILTLPPGVDLAYAYGSTDGGTWRRIPTGHEFLEPASGTIDLKANLQPLLGDQSSGEADMDLWGWSGGALVHLGQMHVNAKYSSLAICNLSAGCSGDASATHWVTEAVVSSDSGQASRKFQWKAPGADINYAIWQVSTQPFPAEYSVGAPPGLLISGISDASVNTQSGSARGDFTIDFNTDLQIPSQDAQPAEPKRVSGFLGQTNSIDPALLSAFVGGMNTPLALMSYQPWVPQKLYIRVTPMAGGHPAAEPSNTVLVNYTPTGDPPSINISKVPSYKLEVIPDSYVNEVKVVQQMGILGCAYITGVDHDTFVEWFKQAYQLKGMDPSVVSGQAEDTYQWWYDRIGWKACPGVVEEDDPSIFEQFGAAFVEMINALSTTLEQIKGTLVEALAQIIPGCDASCKSMLMTGLNFAITYFTGLPPSIPNFDEAVNMGIDYAVQMAISQAGIPYCDQTCQDLIEDEVKEAGKAVLNSGKSQPGCKDQNFTFWVYEGNQLYHLKPLCFPPGVSFEPIKGSMYERAMVQVRVTRIDGSPEPAPMQQLIVDTQALNAAYGDGHTTTEYYTITTQGGCKKISGSQSCSTFTQQYPYTMHYDAPLVGTPYPEKMVTVPALAAGQSVVVPVVFEGNYAKEYKPPDVYSPRALAILLADPTVDLNSIPVDWNRDFQNLTNGGAKITINARMLCQDKTIPLWNSPCSDIATRDFIVP